MPDLVFLTADRIVLTADRIVLPTLASASAAEKQNENNRDDF